MTKIADIYEGDSHQLRHCDPCDMPEALRSADNPSYSLLKHVIIESRHFANDPEVLESIRTACEAQGALDVFESAQRCIRCAEGMVLLIEGVETNWRVGGSLAIE